MTFDQHYSFIKEGIKTFEEQTKKLEEIKKEKELEKEREKEREREREREREEEKEIKNGDNYDIIIDNDYNINDNNNNNLKNNENKPIKKNDNGYGNNLNININNINTDRENENTKKKLLGRKRKNAPNSVKHHLMMDLICSIDDFIYNKRNIKITEYDSFFEDIQLKISQNQLNTNGLNVSIYLI